jgi:transposase
MELYSAIDLHSNNSVLVVMDEDDKVVFSKRLPNQLEAIVQALRDCGCGVSQVAVESTYNWYWLVDGLSDAGFTPRLVNTAAVKQYDGIKHTGDFEDARHLAFLLHHGMLPTGYICPRELRATRDLARKRIQMVRVRTQQVLSAQNMLARNLGYAPASSDVQRLDREQLEQMPLLADQRTAIQSTLAVLHCADEQAKALEKQLISMMKRDETYRLLQTISGVGPVLALTIALETGEIGRFSSHGDFASYARLVDSKRISNGKTKGSGNVRCGNAWLCWAFIEAAHFAIRHEPKVKKYYERKSARSKKVIAMKAVAHKLARAAYHVMVDRKEFDVHRAFS